MAAAFGSRFPSFVFDSSLFVAGHGRSPRGVGCWAFGLGVRPFGGPADLPFFVSPPLSLAAAKKHAAFAAAAAGVPAGSVLYLLP